METLEFSINGEIYSATPVEATDQVLYVSTVPKYAVRSKLWKTTNGGTAFTNITGTLPDRFYSKIAVDPTNHNRIAVALSGFGTSDVYLSTNAGTNWTDIGGDLPDVPANTLAFDPDNVGNPGKAADGDRLDVRRGSPRHVVEDHREIG